MRLGQARRHDQALFSRGGFQEMEHLLITAQGFTGPIQTDRAKQSMLDPTPFRGARRIMADGHRQPGWIDQIGLQGILPQARPITIAPTPIRQDQELGCSGVVDLTSGLPPPVNRIHREGRRVRGDADRDKAGIALWIVNAVRNRDAFRQRPKVIDVDPMRITTSNRARVLKPTDQLAFLGVHLDHGPTLFTKGLFLGLQILKLFIAIGTGEGQLFVVDLA